jgi:hypothetical protein
MLGNRLAGGYHHDMLGLTYQMCKRFLLVPGVVIDTPALVEMS